MGFDSDSEESGYRTRTWGVEVWVRGQRVLELGYRAFSSGGMTLASFVSWIDSCWAEGLGVGTAAGAGGCGALTSS